MPTILLIHGAFGGSNGFDRVAPLLEQAGYPTVRAEYLSTNSEKPAEVTAQKDIDFVRKEYLVPLVEKESKDIIIVVHSFGGVIAGGSANGLSKTDRKAQNLPGGVLGLVYISGNLVHEGQTMVDSVGGEWPAWLIRDKPSQSLSIIDPLIESLAHDADPSLEPEIHACSLPQGYRCFETSCPAPAWAEKGYTNRLAYIRTADDRINPAFAQDLWIQGTGVKWEVVTMNTSHAPYISQPKQLSQNIVALASKFESLDA